MNNDFENKDYWKAIVLYGLNTATYKIALGKTLLNLTKLGKSEIAWETLAKEFLNQYLIRLKERPNMPQLILTNRKTEMEKIVQRYQMGNLSLDEAIQRTAKFGFKDVIPRFQTIGNDKELIGERFYHFEFGKNIRLRDEIFRIGEDSHQELIKELDARWSLLEGAFKIRTSDKNWELINSIEEIYLSTGYDRTNLTLNIPFLQGYQGNLCFYCGEKIKKTDVIHVDHVLPRKVLNHDEIWNLVLSHSYCNAHKSDKIVPTYYLEKLITRNENIMGSNHPWKFKIEKALGSTKIQRITSTKHHYNNVITVLGKDYWGGIKDYIPEKDLFYRQLITKLNNR